jgi:CheY-like chemotaxis protein
MKRIRLLIVEDEPELSECLSGLYRTAFAEHGYGTEIEHAANVSEARRLAKSAKEHPYDLVSLDVNLGDAELSGLDVLNTLRRFQSGWMVALLTGVETDASLDVTMGATKGDRIRKQLRRDAYARFPAERLMVVEKPVSTLPAMEAEQLLANRVGQIALLYREVGRLRYVFRPIEVVSLQRVPTPKSQKARRQFIETAALHWQIRFNCDDIRTLPDKAGLRTLHHLLSMERGDSLTPEQAQAIEPKQERHEAGESADGDPVAKFFEAQGIAWNTLSKLEQDKLIAAALALRFRRYVELRAYEEDDDLAAEEADELEGLRQELGPLALSAETAYQRMAGGGSDANMGIPPLQGAPEREGLHSSEGGNYEKASSGRRGYDSTEARAFRKRMERVRDYLRENGFAEFATHLESYLMSTGANWSYNPPEGVEWTT